MGKENMTAGSSDENTGLTVEILSITVDSQITACFKGKPVKLPNWEPGIDLIDGYGSKRPGVFEMAGKPSYKGLKVKVKVKGLSNKKIIKLTGKLAGLRFIALINSDNSTGKTGRTGTVRANVQVGRRSFSQLRAPVPQGLL